MRIGLLGGTFNPIHYGHLHIAEQTCQRVSLDQILFIPSADPPHKAPESLAPAIHRLAMVKAAIAPIPKFHVSDIELRSPGKSFTYDTIQRLRQEFAEQPDLFFLVGLDAFRDFASWKRADDLLHSCHFIVVSRPGCHFAEVAEIPLFANLPAQDLQELDANQRDHVEFSTSATTTLTFLAIPPCEISASVIREYVKNKRSVSHWLPASVESYIIQHHLYHGN